MKTFIIAEAGVNHNGKLDIALALVDAAKEAGADAVKFQTFTASAVVTRTAATAVYQAANTGSTESQFELLHRLELPHAFYPEIQARCKERDILFLSTPFSIADADFLEGIGVAAYKIPSGEITNLPFLRHVAKKGKRMIVSTGMADLEETWRAVSVIRHVGNMDIILLHSTSNYPPSLGSLNLHALATLKHEFAPLSIPVGYSDNGSEGFIADVIAVALGACMVEKHFTLDRAMEGPDHRASASPVMFREMVRAIRDTETILGSGIKRCTPEEESIRDLVRKSIVASRSIAAGELFSEANLTTKRPGTGVSPMHWDDIVGRPAKRLFHEDELIEL